jgi:hypothetical protein
VGLWKNIRMGRDCFLDIPVLLWVMGPRSDFGMMCGAEMTLKEAFPDLYNFARVKDASVTANLDFSSGSLQWNVSFTHTAQNWEVDVLASFYTLLHCHRVSREGEDKLWWAPSHKKKFDVSSFYKILFVKMYFLFLKEYLANQNSFESGFFRLLGGFREDSYREQF